MTYETQKTLPVFRREGASTLQVMRRGALWGAAIFVQHDLSRRG